MTQSDAQHEQHPRSIKSFVLRQGHMTPAQQRAIDENWPRFGLDFQHAPVDLNAAFGREAPKILEIGFGMGTATAEIATSRDIGGMFGLFLDGHGGNRISEWVTGFAHGTSTR